MSPISHALLPTFIGRRWISTTNDKPTAREFFLIAFCGVLPDILSPHWTIESRHASLSHTIYALGLFSSAIFIASRAFPLLKRLSLLCIFAYALHIFCDAIAGGVNLFYPYQSKVYGRHYLPFLAWLISDAALLFYVYMIYRWVPMRKRMRIKSSTSAISHDSNASELTNRR